MRTGAFCRVDSIGVGVWTLISPITAFVLSRAVQGAMRAAVLEGADFLLSQEMQTAIIEKLGIRR